jgi:Zn-dependent oligopeptidase
MAMNKKEKADKEFIKKLDEERRAKYHNNYDPDFDRILEKLGDISDQVRSAIEYVNWASTTEDPEQLQDIMYDASSDLHEHWHMRDLQSVLWDCAEAVEFGDES